MSNSVGATSYVYDQVSPRPITDPIDLSSPSFDNNLNIVLSPSPTADKHSKEFDSKSSSLDDCVSPLGSGIFESFPSSMSLTQLQVFGNEEDSKNIFPISAFVWKMFQFANLRRWVKEK